MSPVIVWFRRNLRLHDNSALIAAAATGRPVIPVYAFDEQETGGAGSWWLHRSLHSLDRSLRERGSRLHVVTGEASDALANLVRESAATEIYFARRYEPARRAEEQRVRKALGEQLAVRAFDDSLLRRPGEVLTRMGGSFRVFTPFWRASAALGEPPAPRPIPADVRFAELRTATPGILEPGPLPMNPDWADGLRNTWRPGEDGALDRLDAAVDKVSRYADERDRPDIDATSMLSPHLHFGEISPAQVWHAIQPARLESRSAKGSEALLRQLYWRDFSGHLLYHYPDIVSEPLRPAFAHFPWSTDRSRLKAWQRGLTGYPIVDAGMRQLWKTGWMHNRVRMVVASFLVKDLMIPWQDGAAWFMDTLVDADLANNSAGWQWVAGCGTDAAPYFRIFNPVLQGRKFDPLGDYVRRWVPEIGRLPAKYLHEPWLADLETQKAANVVIGEDYPQPIVDHHGARERALAAYRSIRDRTVQVESPGSVRCQTAGLP